MQWLKAFTLALCISLVGIGSLPASVLAHEGSHFHMDQSEYESLKEQGFSKKEIYHAKGISKLAKKDIKEVLEYYKESGSWEKAADHFDIDVQDLKKKQAKYKMKHEKMKKFYQENESGILAFIAEYSALSMEELQLIQAEHSLKIPHLLKAAVIAKLSNSALIDVLNDHKAGKEFAEVARDRNVKKEEFIRELKRIHIELMKNSK